MSKKMQRSLIILIVALIGALTSNEAIQTKAAPSSAKSPAGISPTEWYPVKKVVDGDTIDVSVHASTTRVRLIGLDTPEVVDPRKPVQCFGKEASNAAKRILTGQTVRLETDPSQDTYDKYGRLLAYMYASSTIESAGTFINEYMIAEGYGHEYTYDLPYKYQSQFKAAEKSAHEAGRGLWAPGICTT